MKYIFAIPLLIVVASTTAYIGFRYGQENGRAYQKQFDMLTFAKVTAQKYRGDAPPSTNPDFQQAYKQLCTLSAIEGSAVGPGGGRGMFHQLFEPIYEHGDVTDFKTMALYTNPIVRAMGLLCLKYRAPSDANYIALEYQYDNESVDLFSFGCGGSAYPFREIAYMHILGGEDFIGTRKIAEAIDGRRP